jgi:hypothetical protein
MDKLEKLCEQAEKPCNEGVKIPVKHVGILGVPADKKFYELPMSHYDSLVKSKGYSSVIHALVNQEVFHKNHHPEIANKARAIITHLQKNHKEK